MPLLAQDVGDQVGRAAVGVVQLEQLFARERAVGLAQRSLSRRCMPASSVCAKRASSALQRALDELALGDELRIGLAHHLDQRRDHAPERTVGLQRAELPEVAHARGG